LLAQWPGTHSRILSGIQQTAQTVLGIYLKRTCSRDTSASSALGVLNDYVLYKSTHSLTHSLTINYTGTDSDKQVIILSNTQKAQNVHQHRQIYPQQQKNGHLLRKSQNYKNLHNQSSVTTVHRLSPSINCYISLICSLLILQVAVSGDDKYPTTLAHARYFINFKMH